MNKFPVYAIRDTKGNSFGSVVVSANDETIKRSWFESIASGVDRIVSYSPCDFDLFKIADFDVETGVLTPVSPVLFIANGGEYAQKK